MKKINTATGEIDITSLGKVLSHEHIAVYSPSLHNGFGESWIDIKSVAERAIALLKQAKKECLIDTIIDGTPIDIGRNEELLKYVSQESGVNIILSSGMYFCEEAFLFRQTPSEFAKHFINECLYGIKGSGIKPNILKCATGASGFTKNNRLLLDTMSIVQRETRLPLYAHNEHRIKTAYEQLKVFEKKHVNLEKVIIGHCSDTDDITYLEDIAKSGCYLGFDRISQNSLEHKAMIIAEMIDRGCENKILLSHDYCVYCDMFGENLKNINREGQHFAAIDKMLIPLIKKYGVSDEKIYKITNINITDLFED